MVEGEKFGGMEVAEEVAVGSPPQANAGVEEEYEAKEKDGAEEVEKDEKGGEEKEEKGEAEGWVVQSSNVEANPEDEGMEGAFEREGREAVAEGEGEGEGVEGEVEGEVEGGKGRGVSSRSSREGKTAKTSFLISFGSRTESKHILLSELFSFFSSFFSSFSFSFSPLSSFSTVGKEKSFPKASRSALLNSVLR